ncbi:MAG: Oxidoreductase [Nocardioides sp.]|nr:Oxidoreductase [Nocardioides sp.]
MSKSDAGPLSAALVGLGWWGSRIARTLQDSPVLRPVIGVDPSPEARAVASERHGIPTAATLEEALTMADVDVVIICSPHQQHAAQIITAAEAGCHVFVEKPFTLNLDDCRRALQAVEAAGVQVGIGYERRFEPAVEALSARCAAGDLGQLMLVEANFSHDRFLALPSDSWRLSSQHAPVGPLSATGIHLVDLAINLLGRPVEVWASCSTLATSFENGDALSVMMTFESGATAHLNAVLATPFQGRLRVFGANEWVEIADRTHPDAASGWDVTRATPAGAPETTFEAPFDSVRENLERFGSWLLGGAPYPITPEQIQLSVATSDAIMRSALHGGVQPVAEVLA